MARRVTSLAAIAVLLGLTACAGRTQTGCQTVIDTPAFQPPSTPSAPDADHVVFAGQNWEIRSGQGEPTTLGEWDTGLVVQREDGALVLEQRRLDDAWYSAEVMTTHQGFGYGTYRWWIESPLHDLDPQTVLGLFTYEHGALGNREIDVEVARWSDPDGPNLHFTQWARETATHRTHLRTDGPTEHRFTWLPGEVHWCSLDADGRAFAGASMPTVLEPGEERVHMNLWITGARPPAGPTRVVVTDFSFHPLPLDEQTTP